MFWLHSLSYTLIALIYFILISRIARTYFLYGISLHHYIGSMSCRSPAMLLPPDFQQLDFYDTWYPAQHHTITEPEIHKMCWHDRLGILPHFVPVWMKTAQEKLGRRHKPRQSYRLHKLYSPFGSVKNLRRSYFYFVTRCDFSLEFTHICFC